MNEPPRVGVVKEDLGIDGANGGPKTAPTNLSSTGVTADSAVSPSSVVDLPSSASTMDLPPEYDLQATRIIPPQDDPAATFVRPGGTDVDGDVGGNHPQDLSAVAVQGYQILGELGRGGMGVVYRAKQKKLDRIVAIKMVLAGAHAGPEQLERFYIEARAVAHLQHPNIVQIYEVGEQAGLPYFSLEFVDGGSLDKKAARKPQPPREAAEMVQTLAGAMHSAHKHGVIHRDLKPANILLTRDGSPKITDFGLAKRLEGESSQTRSGAIMGTPSYMAPEQAKGDTHQIGPLVDVYALGAILYELLTGRPPFAGPSAMDTVMQVVRDEPVPPTRLQPKLPADIETICLKCLQKEPRKRYDSAELLAEDLRRFLAGEPILARPVSGPERLWRWCRRNPKMAALSASVLLLLVVVAVGSSAAAVKIAFERDEKEKQRGAAVTAEGIAKTQKALAEERREKAEAAEKRATEKEKIASEQRQLALDTLYNVVTKVDEQLRDRTEMHKLRLELIEDAMSGLRRVEESDSTRSLVDRSMGVGHQRMADIFQQMGRSEDALSEHKRALEIFDKLLEKDSLDHWARWDAALSSDKVGDLSRVLGGAATDVKGSYLKALQHREKLPADLNLEKLTAADVQRSLVNSYAKLGTISMSAGDLPAAREYFGKTLAQSEELYAKNPNSPQAKQALSGSYFILGRINFRLQEVDVARDYYDKSLALRQELMVSDPLSVGFRRLVAAGFDARGDLSLQLSKAPAQAVESYENSRRIYAELHATNPKDADSQMGLAAAHYRLGTAKGLIGKPQEAAADYTESLKLREDLVTRDPKNTAKLIGLIHVRARLGSHHESFQASEELRERVGTDPSALYNLVCGYSLCANAVRTGRPVGDMSAEERQAYDRYLSRAIETLRSAMDRGYNDVTALETDPDLESLRGSPDFESVIRGLKK